MASTEAAVVTLAEAADLLAIGRRTAYELVARSEFPVPVLRIGRSMRVSRAHLFAFIDGPANLEAAS